MKSKVASNLVWMLAERGLQVAGGIAIVAMLARGLGTEGFAHFQYAQAVAYIAASITLICGGEVVIPRLVSNTNPAEQHRLVMHVFVLRLGAGLLAYLLMCVFLLITGQDRAIWTITLVICAPVMLREPFGVVTAWMQARTHARPNAVFNVSSLTVKAAGVGILFWMGSSNVLAYAALFAFEPIVAAVLLSQYYLARAPRVHIVIEPSLIRQLFTDGALFWASFMLMMASRRIDQLILKPFVSLPEFGAYAASMQILDNFTMLAGILAAGIAPMYVYAQPTIEQARRNIARIAVFMFGIGLTGGVIIAACSHWIIHLLYGSAYASAADLLRLSALASTLLFADVGLTLLAIYLRRPKLVAIKWGFVFASTVAIDIIAIPKLGARGAILGYCVANLLTVAFGIGMLLRARALRGNRETVAA
nr:oligosaccharide flippase family protein [uncultured Cupriavidus sp.]